jgi:hypothetical protein
MAVVVFAFGGASVTSGCGGCTVDCGAPDPDQRFLENATLVERTDELTHADGSEIDTGLLPDVTLASVAWVTFGGFAAIVILWGTARRVRALRG